MPNEELNEHDLHHQKLGRELTDAILEVGRKNKAKLGCILEELVTIIEMATMAIIENNKEKYKFPNN